MPQMVEWYRKTLLSFGMETRRLPKARSSAPRKARKRPRDECDHLYDKEDSDDARYDSLVPQPSYAPSNQRREPHHLKPIHHATATSGTKRAPQVRPPGTPMAASHKQEQELGSSTL